MQGNRPHIAGDSPLCRLQILPLPNNEAEVLGNASTRCDHLLSNLMPTKHPVPEHG